MIQVVLDPGAGVLDHHQSMQSLRDKLLKSGLVDKKEARKAKTESRRARKKRGARAEAEEVQQRKREYEQRVATEAQESREQATQRNEDRARREHAERLRNIIERHSLIKIFGEQRRFFFVRADRRIHRLDTTHPIGERLVSGELAVVAAPYDPERAYRLVERAVAERVEALEASYLLFWNKPGAAEQPTYGAKGPCPAGDS